MFRSHMEIILSTRNQSKLQQIRNVLAGLDLSVLSLEEAGIEGEVVEDGNTLEENAFKKALFATRQSGKWAIADDTGLFIDAWGGEPGIHAARWAGDGLSTEEIMLRTLQRLEGVPLEGRTASFKTCAVITSPDEKESCFFTGTVRGTILTTPRTACQPNMPYSAIFVPDGQDKTWAEMSVEEENAISHRGKAFRQVRQFFAER